MFPFAGISREPGVSGVRRAIVWYFTCLLLLAMAACTAFPDQELTSYREAYIEAQKAGDLLYDELSAAVVRAGQAAPGSNCVHKTRTRRAPTCFDPAVARADGTAADIPSIRARRTALETVELYNLAVLDVLEGKQGDALSTRIGELRDVASDLLVLGRVTVGPLPALIGGQSAALLGSLVKQLDKFTSEQRARASLAKNAPVVNDLIQLLIDDTPKMYNLYQKAQGKYAVEVELSGSGKAAAAEYAKIGAYHDQLTAYVKLLDQTKASFNQLVFALENGTASTAELRSNIRQAIEVRKAAEAFWKEVRKANRP